eukprot:8606327-Pyramimonas_sp.AAC.1
MEASVASLNLGSSQNFYVSNEGCDSCSGQLRPYSPLMVCLAHAQTHANSEYSLRDQLILVLTHTQTTRHINQTEH